MGEFAKPMGGATRIFDPQDLVGQRHHECLSRRVTNDRRNAAPGTPSLRRLRRFELVDALQQARDERHRLIDPSSSGVNLGPFGNRRH